MTTEADKINRIQQRLEVLIQAMQTLATVGENHDEKLVTIAQMLVDLDAWLRRPQSSGLADTLAAIQADLAEIKGALIDIRARVGGRDGRDGGWGT